jgi:hypothetical protein
MLALHAEAKDCTPIETAPGVKTRPVGCADFERELTARKPADPDNAKGVVYNRDGTTVRVNGAVRVDTGVINGKR